MWSLVSCLQFRIFFVVCAHLPVLFVLHVWACQLFCVSGLALFVLVVRVPHWNQRTEFPCVLTYVTLFPVCIPFLVVIPFVWRICVYYVNWCGCFCAVQRYCHYHMIYSADCAYGRPNVLLCKDSYSAFRWSGLFVVLRASVSVFAADVGICIRFPVWLVMRYVCFLYCRNGNLPL